MNGSARRRTGVASGVGSPGIQGLPLPRHFAQAAAVVTEEMIGASVACGPDVHRHLAAITPYLDAGYDEVYLAQVGSQQDGFFAFYAEQVLPRLRDLG